MKIAKSILATLLLTTLMTTAFAIPPFKNGKVILTITVKTDNATDWKKNFDTGAPIREKGGIKVLSVCSSLENDGRVMVIEEAENAQSAHNFLTILKAKQKEGGFSLLETKLYDKVE